MQNIALLKTTINFKLGLRLYIFSLLSSHHYHVFFFYRRIKIYSINANSFSYSQTTEEILSTLNPTYHSLLIRKQHIISSLRHSFPSLNTRHLHYRVYIQLKFHSKNQIVRMSKQPFLYHPFFTRC